MSINGFVDQADEKGIAVIKKGDYEGKQNVRLSHITYDAEVCRFTVQTRTDVIFKCENM